MDAAPGSARVSPPAPTAPPGTASPFRAPPRFALAWRWALLVGLAALTLAYTALPWRQWVPQRLTQDDIDAAVLQTLTSKPMPSPAALAYGNVMPSVVRVIGLRDQEDQGLGEAKDVRPPSRAPGDKADPKGTQARKATKPGKPAPKSDESNPDDDDGRTVGTGVVIIDNGTILTNMHVVTSARRVQVQFADGLVADADIIGMRPEHDLAVLRARKIPDDLKAATMRSTEDLRPGDRVTAIGFPFGIGPSVSHGVVSGLKRDFRTPGGAKVLSNLIQFDAAANPGNSGGPLVTDDGAVVGIVTAIYNPTAQRFFVGLGFAVPIENAAQAAGMPPF
jgi:serine protease DegQ